MTACLPVKALTSSALCWPTGAPLYKVLRCLDTHAVSGKEAFPPFLSAQLFEGTTGEGGKTSQRFVALSDEFFCLLRDTDIAITDRFAPV